MLKLITAAATIALLTSCATANKGQDTQAVSPPADDTATPVATPKVDASAPLSTSAVDLAESNASQPGSKKPVVYRGNDRQVKMPAAESPVRFVGDDVSLNFEQAPLSEVMHAIMGDILQLDYAVDNPVKGQVTLRTRTPIPRDQLLDVLESLLIANKVIMIRGSDGRYLVTGSQQGAKLSPGVSNPGDVAAGFSTIIVPLQYISASSMAEILQPVAEPEAFVRIDNARNLLMLAGTRNQLVGWLDMVTTFDVDMLAGMSVGMFPLENSSVEEATVALSALLNSGGVGDEAVGGLSQLIRVIPVARLNSILVVTPRAHYLDKVQTWIKRLDAASYSEFDKRLYVYPVQNTTAQRLAELLNRIYSGGGPRSGGGRGSDGNGDLGYTSRFSESASSGVAPGMSRESIGASTGSPGAFLSLSSAVDGGSGISAVDVRAEGPGNISPLADVRVVADEENNSLMIYSTGVQYQVIEAALEQLDVVATQVVIEASILEVTLTDKLRYGLEWSFNNNIGNDYEGIGQLANAATGPAAVVPGFSYAITNSIGDIKAVLNALAEESLINVISTPSVMVLDNHEAYIHVGDQVPIFSAQTTTDGGVTTQSVEYKDTGVQLNVRPSVNAGGLITMQIAQSVTDVGTVDSATGQRSFLERSIMSRVAVRSSESVVLGGLIRENASNTESGVPFLYKLPVIGPLFGSTDKEDRRTELLVIITPRAIYNEQELREVSKEMRSQIRHMELIELPGE
jgi:general secretion pathway protein D